MTANIDGNAEKEKRNAAFSSVLSAAFLTILKLVVGLLTGSLGIVAEAVHSGLDLVAALVTFFAVRFSDQPPDEQHLYGHGKIENLSALIETLLLLITCVWIIYEAIQRLFFKTVEVQVNIWAFTIMGVSLVVLIIQSRILHRAARKHNSQALEADALHFSTDIWSSLVVVLGLFLVWLGERLGPEWIWLAKADAVAALIVSGIVIFVSLQLGQRAVSALLDTAPPGMVGAIIAEAGRVQGVQSVGTVRVRQAGADVFVDLAVEVDHSSSLEEAHQVAEVVDRRVSKLLTRGDVVVHVDPGQRSEENLAQTVSAIAARLGLRAHNVHAHEVRGHHFVDLHVEVPPEFTLGQAHDRVKRLETAVREELPRVHDVHSHVEPIAVSAVPVAALNQDEREALKTKIAAITQAVTGLDGCPQIHIRPGPDGYDLALECLADPDLPIGDAHQLAHETEKQIRAQVAGISKLLVQVKPAREE